MSRFAQISVSRHFCRLCQPIFSQPSQDSAEPVSRQPPAKKIVQSAAAEAAEIQ